MNGSKSQCDNDTIGPICFVTPEIGRWSTIGGLGVMVDELTQGLSALGQDVIVISPYYDRNRKGESNYLIKDEIFFSHKCNIDVYLDKKSNGLYSKNVRAMINPNLTILKRRYLTDTYKLVKEEIIGSDK